MALGLIEQVWQVPFVEFSVYAAKFLFLKVFKVNVPSKQQLHVKFLPQKRVKFIAHTEFPAI